MQFKVTFTVGPEDLQELVLYHADQLTSIQVVMDEVPPPRRSLRTRNGKVRVKKRYTGGGIKQLIWDWVESHPGAKRSAVPAGIKAELAARGANERSVSPAISKLLDLGCLEEA